MTNLTSLKPRHRMIWHGSCYACICRVCNLKRCRYNVRMERCLACIRLRNRAVLDCDGFESKYERKVYHIKSDLLNKRHPSVARMVREMYQAGKWRP